MTAVDVINEIEERLTRLASAEEQASRSDRTVAALRMEAIIDITRMVDRFRIYGENS